MKPSIIKRTKPLCLLHPWDKRRIQRNLHRRATLLFRVGVGLFIASAIPFIANAPLPVLYAALVAILTAGVLLGRAWFLSSAACKIDV